MKLHEDDTIYDNNCLIRFISSNKLIKNLFQPKLPQITFALKTSWVFGPRLCKDKPLYIKLVRETTDGMSRFGALLGVRVIEAEAS